MRGLARPQAALRRLGAMQRLALGTQASEEQAIVTTKKDYDAAKYGGWKSAKMLFTEVPEKPQIVGRWDWHVVQFLLALVPPGLVLLLVQWARRDMAHMSQRIQGPERQQREQAAAAAAAAAAATQAAAAAQEAARSAEVAQEGAQAQRGSEGAAGSLPQRLAALEAQLAALLAREEQRVAQWAHIGPTPSQRPGVAAPAEGAPTGSLTSSSSNGTPAGSEAAVAVDSSAEEQAQQQRQRTSRVPWVVQYTIDKSWGVVQAAYAGLWRRTLRRSRSRAGGPGGEASATASGEAEGAPALEPPTAAASKQESSTCPVNS